jgi:hypothetical protein
MTEEQIITNNKLIAEFMDYKPLRLTEDQLTILNDAHRQFCPSEHLLYHKSWEWLIPVVEKVGELIDISISPPLFSIAGFKGALYKKFSGNTLIDATYKGCIAFIEWYNESKQDEKKK